MSSARKNHDLGRPNWRLDGTGVDLFAGCDFWGEEMRVLEWLFPPRLKGRWIAPEKLVRKDGDMPKVVGDGILWVGYDVKMTGIERMAMLDREANFLEYPAC